MEDHGELLLVLAGYNRTLRRLGVSPMIEVDAAAPMADEALATMIEASADYIVSVARALRGITP